MDFDNFTLEIESFEIVGKAHHGTVKTCNVRLSGTDIVKVSGSTWEFSHKEARRPVSGLL